MLDSELSTQLLNIKNDISMPSKTDSINVLEKHMQITPGTLFLKNIGLSLIKLQYPESYSKASIPKTCEQKPVESKEENTWQSVWVEEQKGLHNFRNKNLLESRFNKTYRCPFNRSRLCHNSSRQTRLTWMHHIRRGHMRINSKWKQILSNANNSQPENIFEILCNICQKNSRPPYLSPENYVQHMTKHHAQFLPYNEYMSYFQRCFLCNDATLSFQHNLAHRQLCLAELLKNLHKFDTEHFNNCFKSQPLMPILSNMESKFEEMLKKSNCNRSALRHWLQMKRNGSELTTDSKLNAIAPTWSPVNTSFLLLQKSILSNKMYNNCTCTVSEHIFPGTAIDSEKASKFFIPIPFVIKNDEPSKQLYGQWRKSIQAQHIAVPSNVPWYCEICNAMLKNVRTAYCHIKMCHPTAQFVDSVCDICEKKFLTNEGRKGHFQGLKNCPVARRCMVCKESVSVNDIYEHMGQKHKEALKVTMNVKSCLICRQKVDHIDNHLFDIHGLSNTIQGQLGVGKVNYRNGSFFNCPRCSLSYFTEIELRNHMITSEHFLGCAQCPTLRFYLSWELMRHLSTSHRSSIDDDGRRQTCDICASTPELIADNPMTFTTASEKVRHFIENHLRPCSVKLEDIWEGHRCWE